MTLLDFLEERYALQYSGRHPVLEAYKYWATDMAAMIRPIGCSRCPLHEVCQQAGDDTTCEEVIAANIDEFN